ncbi:MAG: tetratricopeptide repeat protein, partial [Cryomorphaceae bacterium]
MKFPTKIPEKSLRYAAFILTLSLILIIPTAGAQDAQTEKDSLQAYEIPYLVGAAQELTVNAINDLNGLKRNISEDVKGQLMRYIFGAFEEEGSASIQSDLKYDVPPSTLRRRSPITLAKYSSDFETEFEIAEISVDINSFRFTFPESPGPGTYEIYGSYEQYIKDEQGDTLNSNAQEKLVKYIAKRDPVSGKLDVKIISIAFSDPDKMPEFMEEEELKMLSQQYLKWRREGSPLDNLQVMSSEAVLETYNVVQKKRAEKSRSFANTVDKCMKAQARGDIKVAAESFIQAEKMQRSHPFVLSEKDDIRSALTAEIENTDKRTRQAFEAGNYVEADKLITANAGLIDLWSNLNNRRYDDAKKVLELQEEIRNKKEAWQDQLRRIENPTYRKQLQSDLKAQTENKACTGNNDAEDRALAEKLTLLAMIERIEPSGRNSNPQGLLLNALKCNSSFAPAKEELLKINEGDPQKAISFLNDLIYFEPENPHYFFERGRKHFLQGNTEDAQKDFIKTIENDPNNTATRLALAKVDLQKMRYDEAIEQLNILKGISESPETDILKAYAYLERDGHESKEAA